MQYRSPLDHLADHDCELCVLHQTTERVCVMGSGNPKSRIMLIGEAPGEREAETGKVFSGRAGQLLDRELAAAGFVRDELYVTNVVKCRPPDNSRPSRADWNACATYLEDEYEACNPSHVLLMGNTALQAVARTSGITRKRGVRLELKNPAYRGAETMATIHPAFVLRNPGQHSTFSEDIRRFARLVRGDFQAVHVRTTMVNTVGGLRTLRKLIGRAEVIAYDVETRYYPWQKDWAIVLLGVTLDGERTYVVPLYHPDSPFRKRWKEVLKFLRPAFKDAQRRNARLIAQNGKFDNLQLAGAGVFIEHTFDIMLAAHLLDENRPKNLGFLSQAVLGADEYKGMVETKPEKILLEPLKKLARYNGNDTGYTWQLYPKLKREVKEYPRLGRLLVKLMMPASHMMQQVEWRGIYIDKDRLWDRIARTTAMVEEQLEVMDEYHPNKDPDFNYNSTQQLGRWLFSSERRGGLGLSPLEKTKTGQFSTREAVLLHYRGHPAVRALLRYRTLQLKWLNTYLLPWSSQLDSNSRRHTTYKLFGTVTGRLSGDFQQVPRDPFIRSVVGAPPGWTFVTADYSQIELRIAAHCANERRMKRAFDLDEDLHLVMATTLRGTSAADVTKEDRKLAKSVNFGFIYGMYPKKFQAYAFENYDLEVDIHEATLFRRQFFEEFPDLPRWYDRQKRIAHARHQVQSPIGRVRHLPDILSSDNGVRMEAERQAINSPVSSMASDMMLFSMVKLHPQLDPREAALVGTLHDQIFMEVRDDKVDKYRPIIKETMENLPLKKTFGCELSVPIKVDIEAGQHWADEVVIQ